MFSRRSLAQLHSHNRTMVLRARAQNHVPLSYRMHRRRYETGHSPRWRTYAHTSRAMLSSPSAGLSGNSIPSPGGGFRFGSSHEQMFLRAPNAHTRDDSLHFGVNDGGIAFGRAPGHAKDLLKVAAHSD